MDHLTIGERGESLAIEYLKSLNMKILDQNYRTRRGEIDIIAYDRGTIVFIEVKSRINRKYGEAMEAVDEQKQRKIYQTAKSYLHQEKRYHTNCRFDVIEVYLYEDIEINHIVHAFNGNDVEG